MVGHVFLFNPAIQRVKEILAGKELGKILYLYSIRTNLGSHSGRCECAVGSRAPRYLDPLSSFDERPARCGPPVPVSSTRPWKTLAFATLTYRAGNPGKLHVSWLDPKKVRQLVIVGSEKMLVFDDMAPSENVPDFR